MTLYHGSNIEIDKIDLSICKPFKDFGAGFYTTPLQNQALAMARRTVRIYRTGKQCITEFFFDDTYINTVNKDPMSQPLSIKRFNKPDNEWARFVINNRNQNFNNSRSPDCNIDNKYDIVIGPVANDDITALMDVYLAGVLSDDALTRELTFRDLSLQFSFHTERAIILLEKTGVSYG